MRTGRSCSMIEEARSTIHITTYILGWDEGSRALLERLAERASDGRRGAFADRRRRFLAAPRRNLLR